MKSNKILSVLAVTIGFFLGLLFSNFMKNREYKLLPGYGILSEMPKDSASIFVDHFQKNVKDSTGESFNKKKEKLEHPRSVIFELGGLYSYLEKSKNDGATHVRIYFARYNDTLKMVNGTDSYYRTHAATVIFMPARKDNQGEIKDLLSGNKIYQPYNGGISCPPLPKKVCTGEGL